MMIAFNFNGERNFRDVLAFHARDLLHYQYPEKIGRTYTVILPIVGVIVEVSLRGKGSNPEPDLAWEKVFPRLTKFFNIKDLNEE